MNVSMKKVQRIMEKA